MNIPSTLHTRLFVLLLHADSDVTTAKYQILDGYSVIIVKSCMPTMFSKDLYCRHVKTMVYAGKG